MKKILKFLLLILLILIIIYFLIIKKPIQEFSKNYFYMDTYIVVKIYSKNEKTANRVLDNIDKIYSEYHQLTDRYNSYEGINNVYYLNNNQTNQEYIEIDKRLYDIIKYGKNWYSKTNNLLNINMGNILDIWKKYRDNKEGVPTIEELTSVKLFTPDDIILKNNKIKNNKLNLDLGALAKGYTTQVVADYIEEKGFDKYLINAGGNVIVGNHYNNEAYKIGLEDPNNKNNIYKVIKANNKSVVTSGGYERFYEYDNKKYNHIIDPKTLYPADYMKSVTVITENSKLGEILSTYLFLIPVDEGQKIINEMDNVEAIWFTNDFNILFTDGVEFNE